MLGLDLERFSESFDASFVQVGEHQYLLVKARAEDAEKWAGLLGEPARRCYVSDAMIIDRVAETGATGSKIAEAKIPDPGSVMSGDFGEILSAFYLASMALPIITVDPLRWRYKAQRTKAAPGSDIVQLLLPSWPSSSADDRVVCAEVKAKATPGSFDPIKSAGEGSRDDRAGRLVKTLVWLKDKALTDGSDTVTIAQLDRFIRLVDHPPINPDFRAVAVIDAEMVNDEIAKGTMPHPDCCALVVISVPELRKQYTALFAAIVSSADALIAVPTTTTNAFNGEHP